ncbi:DUF6886 family protein [Lentzea sp. CA-135723]|uniref:DUF6886 family protein n=1 Tax=Lentzea sp. CA-135723 TaxID=3239950 RepID=UPI003D8AAA8A
MHAAEYRWLERMRTVELYANRFDAARFQPFEDHTHAVPDTVARLGSAERVGRTATRSPRAGRSSAASA